MRGVCTAVLIPVLALFAGAGPAAAQSLQNRYAAIDSAVARYSRSGYRPDSVSSFVKRNFKGDTARVRAFYTWIALNIDYDKTLLDQYKLTSALISNFRPGGRSQDADTVLKHRRAVCEGFCNVMNQFCAEAGISSQMVPGLTKMPEGDVQETILHTWNAVKVHGRWELIDITWAGGYVNNRDQYVRKFSGVFFLTPPETFVKTHWPLDPMWQLLTVPVSKGEFYGSAKPSPKPAIAFNDSIEAYLRLGPFEREYLDLQHYHLNDPGNTLYTEGCDHFVYNHAATVFNRALLYYDDYIAYAGKLRGKEIGIVEVRRCIRLLEEPRRNLEHGLKFARGKKFYTSFVREQFEQMVQASAKRLVEINGQLDAYRKMEISLK